MRTHLRTSAIGGGFPVSLARRRDRAHRTLRAKQAQQRQRSAQSDIYSVQFKPENRWKTPVALRASVEGDRISEWQVYADNEPMRKLMAKADREE